MQVDKLLKSVTHGQCDARPTVTFPVAGHHSPLTGTKLYCTVIEAHACSGKSGKTEVRELHFQRGPLNFSVDPSHEGRAHQMLMRVNIRCHICLSFSQSALVFY